MVPWHAPKRRRLSRRKAKITLNQLPSSVKPEVKFRDISQTVTSVFTQHQLRPFQGDDGDDFIGSECFLKAVDTSLSIDPTGSWTCARVSIVLARDPTVSPIGLINPTYRYGHREFAVLYDEFISKNEKNGSRIKLPLNMKQKLNTTGTTITEGNVLVCVQLDVSSPMTVTSRLYFTDP